MNRSKQKGTAAETAVANYLVRRGVVAHRAPLHGSSDKGDIWAMPTRRGYRIVVQVKAGEQAVKPSIAQVEAWQRETYEQALRVDDSDLGILVLKRQGSQKVWDWPAWAMVGEIDGHVTGAVSSSPLAKTWVCLPLGRLFDVLCGEVKG